MWWPQGGLAGLAIAVFLVYVGLQVVAFGQLTGERRMTGIKYLGVVVLFSLFLFFDWLLHAEAWAAIEEFVLAVTVPFAAAHLAILLIRQARES